MHNPHKNIIQYNNYNQIYDKYDKMVFNRGNSFHYNSVFFVWCQIIKMWKNGTPAWWSSNICFFQKIQITCLPAACIDGNIEKNSGFNSIHTPATAACCFYVHSLCLWNCGKDCDLASRRRVLNMSDLFHFSFSATPSLQYFCHAGERVDAEMQHRWLSFFAGPLFCWEDIATCYAESADSVLTVNFVSQ